VAALCAYTRLQYACLVSQPRVPIDFGHSQSFRFTLP
jgi:hypothetical protein